MYGELRVHSPASAHAVQSPIVSEHNAIASGGLRVPRGISAAGVPVGAVVGMLVTGLPVGTTDGRNERTDGLGVRGGACTGTALAAPFAVVDADSEPSTLGNTHTRDSSEYPTAIDARPACRARIHRRHASRMAALGAETNAMLRSISAHIR
jgi:hypothetical protein